MDYSVFLAIVTHATLLVVALPMGGLVYLHDKKSITNRVFLGFVLSIIAWDITNFFALFFARPEQYQNLDYTLFMTKLIMVSGTLITIFIALLAYVFPKREIIFSSNQKVFFSVFSTIYIISGYFVWRDFDLSKPLQIGSFLPATIPNLPLMPIWGLVTIVGSFAACGYLIMKYMRSEEQDKSRYLSTVIGLSGVTLLPLILFLPVALWNDSRLNFFGPLAYIPIFYGVGYGIVRHKIFNVRLLTTEILVLAAIFILFFNIFI